MPEAAPAPAAFGRVLLALIGAQIGVHGAMAGLRMAASLQALREGYSPWAVGVLLSLFAAGPVLMALHSGRMVDRHGYHRPLRVGVGLGIAGIVLALASTFLSGWLHFGLLCGAATLTGAGANLGLIASLRTAGRAARDHTERVRIFSWVGIAPSFANVVGPVSAGFMIDAAGFRAAYLLLGALPLLGLALSRWVPVEPAPEPGVAGIGAGADIDGIDEAEGADVVTAPAARAWGLFGAPGVRRLLFVNWLLSMCWDVHAFAVPVLGHERALSATVIGLILGSFTFSVSFVRLLIPLLAHRLREVTVLLGAMAGTALLFAIYPLVPAAGWMVGCSIALGLTLGAVQPMILSTLHHLTPPERHGEALALRSMTINASSTLMPLLFGAVGASVGAAVLFWAVGAAVGAGTWAARRLVRIGDPP
jgi:MFS family permease